MWSVPLRVSCPGPVLRLACLGGGGPVPVPPYLAWGCGGGGWASPGGCPRPRESLTPPEDTGHLVVHHRGGPAWLKEHVMALRSWASRITGAEIGLHDHPAISPGDTRALSVDN